MNPLKLHIQSQHRVSLGIDIKTCTYVFSGVLTDNFLPGIALKHPKVEKCTKPSVVKTKWPKIAVLQVYGCEGKSQCKCSCCQLLEEMESVLGRFHLVEF